MYIKEDGKPDKKGEKVWCGDRMDRMIREKDISKTEAGALVLLDQLPSTLKSIADLGCGIGRRHIYFPEMEYVGFDREKVMVENGGKEFPNLDIRLCELMELKDTFPEFNKYFDLVFTFHVVQYNYPAQQQEIFKNIYEIIKPGGYYYMKENEHDCPRESLPSCFKEVCREDNGHTIFKVQGELNEIS